MSGGHHSTPLGTKDCSQEDMDYLDANTRFTQDEISDMAKYAAGERVSRADFDEMCEEHNLQSPSLAARLFDTFDTSDDGIVSFRELVLCLSELTRGTIKDLTKVFFEMYDMNNDNKIDINEVHCRHPFAESLNVQSDRSRTAKRRRREGMGGGRRQGERERKEGEGV